MRATPESLPLGALAIRKNLRNVYPDHRPLTNCVGRDEGKYTNWYEKIVVCEEGPGNHAKRRDVPERANVQQRATTQPVDEPNSDEREDKIGYADSHGLQ